MEKHNQPIILTLVILLSTSSLLTIHGQLSTIIDVDDDRVQTYIVHVKRPNSTNILVSEIDQVSYHKSFLPNLTLDSGKPRLLYSYREAISGFAARLTAAEVSTMSSSTSDFLAAYPDIRHRLLTTYTPKFLGLTKSRNGVWHKNGYGEGVVIGIIDTGVDPAHPSFDDDGVLPPPSKWRGGCDSNACNKKLIGARTYRRNTDSIGHGTHVASIAAGNFVHGANVLGNANGTASGMAPKAHLAIYSVCSKDGCDDSDILAGIDQAIYDNVDILSISVDSKSRPFYEDSIAMGSFSALRHHILTVAAAGNDGPKEKTVINDAPWLLTVGASTTDRRITAIVRLGSGKDLKGESAYQPKAFNSTAFLSLVFPGFEGRGGERGCRNDSFDGIDIKGKMVLCETGYNTTNIEKGKFVKMAGGAAIIVMNSKEQGDTTLSEAHVLPAAHVSFTDAVTVMSYLNSSLNSTPTATIIYKGTRFNIRPSPTIASFSSRGPSTVNGGILKPDIIGPGVNILAAWPTKVGPNFRTSSGSNFNILSGTSMATPHIAGIAALLKSRKPKWSPAAIKSAIMTAADKLDRKGKRIADFFAIGARHVNASKANDPGLIYDHHSHSYIRYLCGLGYTDRQITIITQHHIRCSMIHEKSAEQLNYASISLSLESPRRKTLRRKVTNVGEANSVYFAKVEEPEGVRVEVYPNTLQFYKRYERKSFHVIFTAKSTTQRKHRVAEGQISWVSDNHVVTSSISVTLT